MGKHVNVFRLIPPMDDLSDHPMSWKDAYRIMTSQNGRMVGKHYTLSDFRNNANKYRKLFEHRSTMDLGEFTATEKYLNYMDIEIRKDLDIWEKVNESYD
jgi:hypothetical protein